MPHKEHDQGHSEIEFWFAAETEPTEGLDQWELSDFEELLPKRF